MNDSHYIHAFVALVSCFNLAFHKPCYICLLKTAHPVSFLEREILDDRLEIFPLFFFGRATNMLPENCFQSDFHEYLRFGITLYYHFSSRRRKNVWLHYSIKNRKVPIIVLNLLFPQCRETISFNLIFLRNIRKIKLLTAHINEVREFYLKEQENLAALDSLWSSLGANMKNLIFHRIAL